MFSDLDTELMKGTRHQIKILKTLKLSQQVNQCENEIDRSSTTMFVAWKFWLLRSFARGGRPSFAF